MKRFLICEDDNDMQDFLKIYLTSLEYNFKIVGLGEEVLPTLKREQMNMLLLDLNLPDMDGKEVVQRVRKDPEVGNIPIIIFSASYKSSTFLKDLQVDGYLNKPFELEELDQVIRKNLMDTN